ncbi:MAG TPA: carboxymuconolactone decarboxylase family protein [Rhizomicrobium sp.]|jgi:alkylhydroperoxidase family enzyme|nr:carboxymuconolactone decarboxylase family protein [Rhizomicrobium sp.]
MPRIKPLSRKDAPPEIVQRYDEIFGEGRDPVAEPGTATGTPGDWWSTWGKVPGILSAFSAYSYRNAPLDPALRELAIIRTGYARQSRFVFSQHCKVGRRNGLSDEKIAAIPYWTVADVFTPLERAVLAYVDGQILEGGRVHDKVFDILKAHLSDEEILIVTYLVNAYALHATSTRALRLEYDNVPERVTEIPAPEAPGVQDWLTPAKD